MLSEILKARLAVFERTAHAAKTAFGMEVAIGIIIQRMEAYSLPYGKKLYILACPIKDGEILPCLLSIAVDTALLRLLVTLGSA